MRKGTNDIPDFGDAEYAVSSMFPYRNRQSKAGFSVRQKTLSVAEYLISLGVRYSELAARGIYPSSVSIESFRSPASEREVSVRMMMIDLNIKNSFGGFPISQYTTIRHSLAM